MNFRFLDTIKILAMGSLMLVSCEKDSPDDVPKEPDDSDKPVLTVTLAGRPLRTGLLGQRTVDFAG